MSNDRHGRLRELFLEAVDLPAAARAAFLERAAGSDDGLRRELLALLASHDASDGFMESPPPLDRAVLREPQPGDRVGRFELLAPIGRGGMGVVWRAQQTNPRRLVAVKLLTGPVSADALRRFELESEALGRLRHPGIAQVYEAGVAGDVPYLALELVDGRPLTEYADRQELGRDDRVRLLAAVCDAANHAHQNGVIHRDLKPANILVDRQGRPRILDFGIARIDDERRRRTLRTRAGDIVGTLAYMSPEQIEASAAVDTRTDVYALGVLLYELIAGGAPVDLDDCGVAEAVQRIATREPAPLGGSVPRDLRTIVLKALEKDPDRRYASASELAAELRRYLADEPIVAHPPSAFYQLRKFTRRHRALVAAAILAGIALVAGSTAATVAWLQARAASRRAAEINRVLRDALESPLPYEGGREVTMVEFLDATRERLERELADRPLLRADLLGTLGTTYIELGELEVAESLLAGAVRTFESRGEDPVRRIELQTSLALALAQGDALERGVETARAAAEDGERLLDPDHEVLQLAWHTYGTLLDWAGELESAERVLRKALQQSERTLGADHLDTITTRAGLAEVLRQRGETEEAAALLTRVYEDRRRVFGEDSVTTLDTLNNLAFAIKDLGEDERAMELFRRSAVGRERVYGVDNPRTAVAVHNLGWMLFQMGRDDEALPHLERAVAIAGRVHGEDHWVVGAFRLTLGRTLARLGRTEEARRALESSLELTSAGLGPDHERVADARKALAALASQD
jgi:tetratricopeptide (TPR) repeat protein